MKEAAGAPQRLYAELAQWWPLLSPPAHYVEEAADLLPRLGVVHAASGLAQTAAESDAGRRTLLELGSGGGSLAYHLKQHFRMTLTDRSPEMLAVSRVVNPECEHHEGDMRTLRLGRSFDVVLIHDAIMYATDAAAVRAALATAAIHSRPGGVVAVLPDYVQETFEPGTSTGGEDAEDGRGLRYLEWCWDPDASDTTYTVDYAFLLRERDGTVRAVHDRHIEGLFPRAEWLRWFDEANIPAESVRDPWGRDIFIGIRRGGSPQ